MAIEKVIVIDDEPIIRRSLELQLRGKRLSVALCSTIAEAEKYIARDSFDLMFVDVRLPDGDGTDLLNRLAPRPEKTAYRGHDRVRNDRISGQLHPFRRI